MKKRACIYPLYFQIDGYFKQHCTPDGIESFPDEIRVPMKSVLDHQVARQFDMEFFAMLKEMSDTATDDVMFVGDGKFGADGKSGNSQHQHQDAPDQNSMFVSSLTLVQLRAVSSTGTRVLWVNR